MIKKMLKKTWYSFFSNHPFVGLGRLIVKIFPEKYISRFSNQFFTRKASSLTATLIQSGLNAQYYAKNESEIRRLNREEFWGSEAGKRWHDQKMELYLKNKNLRDDDYLKYRDPLIRQVSELISNTNFVYHTLCEIGTGNGMFLNYLSTKLPTIKRFVGIDLKVHHG
jgi:hypothetical protein